MMDKVDQMNHARALFENCDSRVFCDGCAFKRGEDCILVGQNPMDWVLDDEHTIEHVGYDDAQLGREK